MFVIPNASQGQTSIFHRQAQVQADDGTIYKKKLNTRRINNIKGPVYLNRSLVDDAIHPKEGPVHWIMTIKPVEFNQPLNEGFSKQRLLQLSKEDMIKVFSWADRSGNIVDAEFFISDNSTLNANELRILEKAVLSKRTYFYKGGTLAESDIDPARGRTKASADAFSELAGVNYFPVVIFFTFEEAYQAKQ